MNGLVLAAGPFLAPGWLEEKPIQKDAQHILNAAALQLLRLLPADHAIKLYLINTDELFWAAFDEKRKPSLRVWEASLNRHIGEEKSGLGQICPVSLIDRHATPVTLEY
jgi:hypothetical protein